VVAAVFPLPFIGSALTTLARSAAGVSPVRLPQLLPGDPTGSALLLTLTTLTEFAPVVLIWYLLGRGGETMRDIGLDRRQPGRDALRGIVLAVLAFLVSWITTAELGRIAPGATYGLALGHKLSLIYLLPGLSQAAWAGIIEETAVAGYLLHRLDQLGVPRGRALVISTAVRTSYHLYYGLAVLPVIPFGLLFGWMWQRNKRLAPLIAAHAIYDGVLIGLGVAFSG
jgi:membrane protease YdiL (CAAX protease family)